MLPSVAESLPRVDKIAREPCPASDELADALADPPRSLRGADGAAFDGATGGWALKAQELLFAMTLLVPMHVIILPWVVLSSSVIRRMNARPASTEPSGGA